MGKAGEKQSEEAARELGADEDSDALDRIVKEMAQRKDTSQK
jgi:hypothetical protein